MCKPVTASGNERIEPVIAPEFCLGKDIIALVLSTPRFPLRRGHKTYANQPARRRLSGFREEPGYMTLAVLLFRFSGGLYLKQSMLETDGRKLSKPGADKVAACAHYLLDYALPYRRINVRHDRSALICANR